MHAVVAKGVLSIELEVYKGRKEEEEEKEAREAAGGGGGGRLLIKRELGRFICEANSTALLRPTRGIATVGLTRAWQGRTATRVSLSAASTFSTIGWLR